MSLSDSATMRSMVVGDGWRGVSTVVFDRHCQWMFTLVLVTISQTNKSNNNCPGGLSRLCRGYWAQQWLGLPPAGAWCAENLEWIGNQHERKVISTHRPLNLAPWDLGTTVHTHLAPSTARLLEAKNGWSGLAAWQMWFGSDGAFASDLPGFHTRKKIQVGCPATPSGASTTASMYRTSNFNKRQQACM